LAWDIRKELKANDCSFGHLTLVLLLLFGHLQQWIHNWQHTWRLRND